MIGRYQFCDQAVHMEMVPADLTKLVWSASTISMYTVWTVKVESADHINFVWLAGTTFMYTV